jgi:hypothetical protein
MVLSENKKTSVQKPRILLRLDKNKRFKPSRLIFDRGHPNPFIFKLIMGSALKTFVGSKPREKNIANVRTYFSFQLRINIFF